jgi:RimJ/RimL family protein N-acetyltransferase
MEVTIDWAREQGFRMIEFWSDSRFERAHKYFAKFGFVHDGRVRTMTDGHAPYSEKYFSLMLRE